MLRTPDMLLNILQYTDHPAPNVGSAKEEKTCPDNIFPPWVAVTPKGMKNWFLVNVRNLTFLRCKAQICISGHKQRIGLLIWVPHLLMQPAMSIFKSCVYEELAQTCSGLILTQYPPNHCSPSTHMEPGVRGNSDALKPHRGTCVGPEHMWHHVLHGTGVSAGFGPCRGARQQTAGDCVTVFGTGRV